MANLVSDLVHPSVSESPRISYDVTGADLGPTAGSMVAGNGRINVEFFYVRVQLSTRDPAKNGKFETRLCIAKKPFADSQTISTGFISPEEAQRQFPQQYAQFCEYEDIPTSGTPLHDVPGMSQQQIALLVLYGFRSAEDVDAVPDEQISQQMGYDGVLAARLVRNWLKRARESAEEIKASEIEAAYLQERRAMEDRIKRLEDSNKALMAQAEAFRQMGQMQGRPAEPQMQMVGQGQPGPAEGGQLVDDGGDVDFSGQPDPFLEGPAIAEGDVDAMPDPLA